jgi:hypothetical protein
MTEGGTIGDEECHSRQLVTAGLFLSRVISTG